MLEEGFNSAFMLLAVGMITVGTILALVIVSGNILISLVNRFFPEEAKPLTPVRQVATVNPQREIGASKLAAIVTAVDIATQGKGKVSSIEKRK
ncbi:hypothetical protein R9C00_12910 [Flammeovirgaceae bacterium SG7u.111]|nr:hypothetical protein [Flammeovirgaceae bacterium SG7u.132]WPO38355.1 hypothetical protein R9C00_12910 [Flammeovirgaceae bacterium SG7u.111]